MGKDAVYLILQRKPSRTLLFINTQGQTYASHISKEIESTFAHTTSILSKLKEQGLVKFRPDSNDNRVKKVQLTKKGEVAAVLVAQLADVLEGNKTAKKNTGKRRKKVTPKKPDGEFTEKMKLIQTQIELISKEELADKENIEQEDYMRIGWRLGPYRRELRKIMEIGGEGDVKKAKELDELIEETFKKRESLRG
jgi:DNA-binding MarR family transcriptional regulator